MKRCEPACLAQERSLEFLRGQLSGGEERDIELHLDVCKSCQYLLEQTAANPGSWQEASELLLHDPWRISIHKSGSHIEDDVPTVSLQINQVLELLQPTDDPQMLGRLGSYEVSGVIGGGGMGVVLRATDRSLDRIVAIKVLSPHLAASGAARTRFEREAKGAAAVLHPNVVAIHGVSTESVLPFLVMPYVRGGTLQQRIDSDGPMPLADILRLGTQIAAGLAAAHQQGLVHRDIKPANVLLADGVERIAITDFGLARAVDDASLTNTGVIAGTPQFMSPEQANGEAIDYRTDLFSLGSVLYTLCTGRPPFRADTTYGILRRITDNTPRPIREINSQIPDWLCSIIGKLHAKSADNRYQSADEVAGLLQRCLAHLQSPNTPLPSDLQPNHAPRFRIATWLLPLALTVILGAFAVAWPRGGGEPFSQSGDAPVGQVSDKASHPGDWSEGETEWIDQRSPSPVEIERAATELAEQTEAFFPESPR